MRASLSALILAAASVVLAAPTDVARRSSFNGGRGNYFIQQDKYGSCQEIHEDNDMVVSLSYQLMGSAYPPRYCGRKVEITNKGGGKNNNGVGKSVIATVVDTCNDCVAADIDLSVGVLSELTGGRTPNDPCGDFEVDWKFID